MRAAGRREDRFALFAGAAAAVTGLALLVAWLVPGEADTRRAALLGAGLAGLSGAVALGLKRRAMATADIKPALRVVGVMFGVRALMVAAGIYVAVSLGWGPVFFVVGFFGVYFALQVIELGYVMSVPRGGPDGDK